MNARTVASALALSLFVLTSCVDGTGPKTPEPASVHISPESHTFSAVGDTAQFSATVLDQFGDTMPSAVLSWRVADIQVASVNSRGRVRSRGQGTTFIIVRAESVADSAEIAVEQRVDEYSLTAPRRHLLVGESVQLEEHAVDSRGDEAQLQDIDWSSSSPEVASVDDSGHVTAIARGLVTITATGTAADDTVDASLKLHVREEGDLFIASIDPDVLLPGQTATLIGEGFSATPDKNAVSIEGEPATVLDATTTELTVRVPDRSAFACRATAPVDIEVITDEILAWREHPLASANPLDSLAVGEYLNLTDSDEIGCGELPLTGGSYLVSVYNTTTSPEATTPFRLRGEGSSIIAGTSTVAAPEEAFPQALARAGSPRRLGLRPSQPPAAVGDPSVRPLTVGGTARRAMTGSTTRGAPDPARVRHHQILEANRALVRRLGPATQPSGVARSPRLLSAAAAATTRTVPEAGDTLSFRVPDIDQPTDSLCSVYSSVSGRVVYAGDKAVVVEDTAAALAGTMDDAYEELGREFEDDMLPIVEEYFGDPLAMDDALDGMGRIVMLFSPTINDFESVAGFVSSTNLYPRNICESSNESQMFYAISPVASASAGEFDKSTWRRLMRSTVIHEVKHIASQAERIAQKASALEESWLEESTARIAEEIWARSAFGFEQYGNTGYRASLYCEVRPDPNDWPQCANTGSPLVMMNHFDGLYAYMRASHDLSPLGPVEEGEDWTFYGSGWFFVRWAIDHFADDEAAFLSALTQETSLAGVDNLLARTGTTLEELLGPWSLSLYWDDDTAPHLGHPSWNVHNIYRNLHEESWAGDQNPFPERYPLRLDEVSFGSFQSDAEVRGGSTWLLTLDGAVGGTQLLQLQSSDGGRPPSSLRISILRTK